MERYGKFISGIKATTLTLVLIGCVEPYHANIPDSDVNALVVEGFLNSSENKVAVKLSRGVNIGDDNIAPSEQNAKVTLEEESGKSYELKEEKGNYSLSEITLNASEKYRIHIITKNGKEYASNYILPKPSPPIDSVVWIPSREGVTIEVNTHDPGKNTGYYQWSFEETWSYTSIFYSYFKLVNGVAYPRTAEENIYYCWNTKPSTRIAVASTVQFDEDRVSRFPLQFIPKGDKRIERVYSIIVRQRTIDEKTYNYLKQLENTTENLGGLFDPMPWQAEGNIRNVNDPGEAVLGYFNAGGLQEKRITFSSYDFPFYLLSPRPTNYCEKKNVAFGDLHNYSDRPLIMLEGNPPTAYSIAEIGCVDCRTLGGTNKRPDFMPRP